MNTPPVTPVTVTVPGAGHAIITHVPGAGHTHATVDIRLTLTLPTDETQAAQRITALTTHLRALIGPPRTDDRLRGRAA
jgi:hypothetical protein